jgi:hypothetical protein
MDWNDLKKIEEWCFCGLLATQTIKGIHFCNKHKALKREVERQKEQHGKSKSPNRFYNYEQKED